MRDNITPIKAADYDANICRVIPLYAEVHAQIIGIAAETASPAPRWLDVGCGTGNLAAKAMAAFPAAEFVLADPSAAMLEQARQKLGDTRVSYLNAGSQELESEQEFDVVTASLCHHYFDADTRKTATERIYRALHQCGVYITLENTQPEDSAVLDLEMRRWAAYQRAHGRTEEEIAAHRARWGTELRPITAQAHLALLRNAGFRMVRQFWQNHLQAGFYAVK
ncbi:MAG TPA: class I SAM-dependent methyltransferase [Ruminococcus sp.]|nr:class I SAM-dependent methyltransferase [Ruminococcus sp.]